MNWLTSIRDTVKLNEGSTKRGISAVLTGGITLYLVFKGVPVDADSVLQTVTGKVDFWIGVGLNVIGLLGVFISDEPKTVRIELPRIELQGKPTPYRPVGTSIPTLDERVSDPALPTDRNTETSSGFNDR